MSCSGHAHYDPKASSTSHDINKAFKIRFLGGNKVSGSRYTDDFSMAGLHVCRASFFFKIKRRYYARQAPQQVFGAATEYSSHFSIENFPADGLMGMAFQEVSRFNAPSVFQTLINEGVLSSRMFGLKLSYSGSELFLGGLNHDQFVGDFTWIPLTDPVCHVTPRSISLA
jgi:cathepsin D